MTAKPAYITTSWDDGHPLDQRLADLLARYGLPGTFYVPRRCDRTTMGEAAVRELARAFEIGGHTLDHIDLLDASDDAAGREIGGCKAWIEDVTGTPCRAFCPPKGHFARRHLAMARDAGFTSIRTVELLSLGLPRRVDGVRVLPTTVQAHPQPPRAYVRNALKRRAPGNLWAYVRAGLPGDWVSLADSLLAALHRDGGVFHLWGHSWEIEEAAQWRRLEEVFRLLAGADRRVARVTNSQLADAARTTAGLDDRAPVACAR